MSYPNWGNPYYQPYNPPMPDQLAQLRANQYQQQMQQPNVGQFAPQNVQIPNGANFQQPTPTPNEMIWVQGEAAAKSYIIAPGNTVVLWDSENPVIYIKSSDASGIPSMKILDYKERTEARKTPLDSVPNNSSDYVTRGEWEALEARVDALTSKAEPKAKKTTEKEIENNA